jgi:hypothetical protein
MQNYYFVSNCSVSKVIVVNTPEVTVCDVDLVALKAGPPHSTYQIAQQK